MTSQMTRYASVLDLPLDSAILDLRLAYAGHHAADSRVEYWARLDTTQPDQRVHEMQTWVEKGCHTTNTVRAHVPVLPSLSLNGTSVPYSPPPRPHGEMGASAEGEDDLEIDASIRMIETYWRQGTSEDFTWTRTRRWRAAAPARGLPRCCIS